MTKHAPGYPKTMVHPAYRKGNATAVQGVDGNSGKTFTDYQGTPDRFAPVEVHNADQEAQHRAYGYIAHGEQAAAAVGYQEYPLMLVHPDYEPAVEAIVETRNGAGQITIPGVPGKPAKFAPVQVNSPDEEEAQVAKGYRRPGQADPEAVQRAKACPHVPGRTTQEYPKVVDGVVIQDPALNASGVKEYPKWIAINGHPHGGLVVNSKAEEEQLLGRSPEDEKAAKRVAARKKAEELRAQLAAIEAEAGEDDDENDGDRAAPTEAGPPTLDRDALKAQAAALGIEVGKSWNARTIAKKIAEHQAPAA